MERLPKMEVGDCSCLRKLRPVRVDFAFNTYLSLASC